MVVWWHLKALYSHLCRYVDQMAVSSSAAAAALDAAANSASTSPAERETATLRSADASDITPAAAPAPELFYTDPRVRAAYKLWVRGVILHDTAVAPLSLPGISIEEAFWCSERSP